MGAPTSSATIEFPASGIDDEIRELLEDEGVRFKERDPRELDYILELEFPHYDLETEIEAGIFHLYNCEARYGEFTELEQKLIEKKIPFDRVSRMDWGRVPGLRVFRPGDPNFDHFFPHDDEGAVVVSVAKVREIIKYPTPEETREYGNHIHYKKLTDLAAYLDQAFPTYPPLSDFVKEEDRE